MHVFSVMLTHTKGLIITQVLNHHVDEISGSDLCTAGSYESECRAYLMAIHNSQYLFHAKTHDSVQASHRCILNTNCHSELFDCVWKVKWHLRPQAEFY